MLDVEILASCVMSCYVPLCVMCICVCVCFVGSAQSWCWKMRKDIYGRHAVEGVEMWGDVELINCMFNLNLWNHSRTTNTGQLAGAVLRRISELGEATIHVAGPERTMAALRATITAQQMLDSQDQIAWLYDILVQSCALQTAPVYCSHCSCLWFCGLGVSEGPWRRCTIAGFTQLDEWSSWLCLYQERSTSWNVLKRSQRCFVTLFHLFFFEHFELCAPCCGMAWHETHSCLEATLLHWMNHWDANYSQHSATLIKGSISTPSIPNIVMYWSVGTKTSLQIPPWFLVFLLIDILMSKCFFVDFECVWFAWCLLPHFNQHTVRKSSIWSKKGVAVANMSFSGLVTCHTCHCRSGVQISSCALLLRMSVSGASHLLWRTLQAPEPTTTSWHIMIHHDNVTTMCQVVCRLSGWIFAAGQRGIRKTALHSRDVFSFQ